MKKALFIILSCLIFIRCNNNQKITIFEKDLKKIDFLLVKSYDVKLTPELRLQYSDSLFQILKKRENDSVTRFYLFKLSNRYFNLKKLEQYRSTSDYVYKLSLKKLDTFHIAKSFHYIGDYHYNQFVNDSAYFYYSKAEKYYQKLNITQDLYRIRLYKANISFYEKDFSGCEAAIIEILKSVKTKNDVRLIYDCYITLGNALDGLNNPEKALEYYNKAFLITKNLEKDPQYILLKQQTYNYIGKIYQKDNNHLLAIQYFKKGLILEDTKSLLYANLLNNLGYSKFKLSDKSAVGLLTQSLTIRNQLKSTPGVVSSQINLAEYYLKNKDTVQAFAIIKQAKKQAHDHHIFEDELKSLTLLAKINPKQDSYYKNLFIKLTDSLYNNERAIRNKFARIEFETEEITNQKNNIEAEKNKIASQRWIILGFGLFFTLIIGLLYLTKIQHVKNTALEFEKKQQKSNEEIYQLMLQQQNKIEEGRQAEKKRISQELHDGIMGKLASTRLNLFVLNKKTDPETIKKCLLHIAEIQNIEKEIRSISHDLNKNIFDVKDSFKTIITNLFEDLNNLSAIKIQIEISEEINWETIESSIKMNLYRIFQEALQNIHKYAKATHVTANITKTEKNIHILIHDNGIGFNHKKTKSGIGIKNMKDRANIICATFKIKSSPENGTQIILIIPA